MVNNINQAPETKLKKISYLQALFAFLALFACLAATKAMIWPKWPRAQSLPKDQILMGLQKTGLDIKPLPSKSKYRSADLATSEILEVTVNGYYKLSTYSAKAKERFNFQSAFLTSKQPSLKLSNRQIRFDANSVSAWGLIKGNYVVQSCLVPGYKFPKGSGVTRDQLTNLIDIKFQKNSQLMPLIGVAPVRNYECVIVSVQNNRGAESVDTKLWRTILDSISKSIDPY